ncbi:unnamed protein product [Owenia fusiformis]|uniref:2'-phosphotransferase n=1 Tax=Owenia fusiformis TaxID=6347 RepID=A0A8J1TM27_OWEFU|nr:unnamed protein product [Owenia fusiformis]
MEKEQQKLEMKTTNGHQNNTRLSKRLLYILRYGAEMEGLRVNEGGYVDLNELMKVPMMHWHTIDDVMEMINASMSHRGVKRYEAKTERDHIFIRACYGRKLERNPCHEGTKIPRLLESCMNEICSNLDNYDLYDFPDEYLLNGMIHKLKRQKKLNTKKLKSLLVPSIEHLNLDGVYLTEACLRMVPTGCPNLKVLSLKCCGYVATDHLMAQILKKLPQLETLNLSECFHLTDKTLVSLKRHTSYLQKLDISWDQNFTEAGILNYIQSNVNLKHIDMFENVNFTENGRETLRTIAKEQDLVILLKGL